MVDLPRYVRGVPKSGRVFYYFSKHRGTPAAWPTLSLPDPFDPDFVTRMGICEALTWRDGAFSIAGVTLPDHRSEEFWKAADRALAAKDAKADPDRRSFKALIATFKMHEAYLSKADATRRGYDHYGDLVEVAWGDDLVADLTTVDAQEAIDSMGGTPAAANQFRAYLSRLISFGIPRGYSERNPVEHTEKMTGSEPWPPWPDWAFELFFTHAPAHIALPVVSALFTGQRQCDVLAMPRPRASDATIPVRAQKTGEVVWIPIHSEYRRWIEAVPKADAVQLHLGVGRKGRQAAAYTGDGYRAVWRKLMGKKDKAGEKIFERFQEERIVFHGVRKNAVNMLLEAGCTESQVGAIVNMSEQMVRHYSRDVRVRALARDGMKLLESRWGELRPAALPKRT